MAEGYAICLSSDHRVLEVWFDEDKAKERAIDITKNKNIDCYVIGVGVQDPAGYVAGLLSDDTIKKFTNPRFFDPVGRIIQGCVDLIPLGMIRSVKQFSENKMSVTFLIGDDVTQVKLEDMPWME